MGCLYANPHFIRHHFYTTVPLSTDLFPDNSAANSQHVHHLNKKENSSNCLQIANHCFQPSYMFLWAGIAQSVSRLAKGCMIQGSNPGRGEIFRTCPGQPWDPLCFQWNEYRLSFSRLKRPGRGGNHPSHPAPRLKKYQSYICTLLLRLRGLF